MKKLIKILLISLVSINIFNVKSVNQPMCKICHTNIDYHRVTNLCRECSKKLSDGFQQQCLKHEQEVYGIGNMRQQAKNSQYREYKKQLIQAKYNLNKMEQNYKTKSFVQRINNQIAQIEILLKNPFSKDSFSIKTETLKLLKELEQKHSIDILFKKAC